jgi:hypothetical protein
VSRYRFTDTQARVYVERALLVEPGDVVDWPDGAPDDGQWELVQAGYHDVVAAHDLDDTEDQAPSAPETEE